MKSTSQAAIFSLPTTSSDARSRDAHPSNGPHTIRGVSGDVSLRVVPSFPEPCVAVAVNGGSALEMTHRQTYDLVSGFSQVLTDPRTPLSVQMMTGIGGSLQMLAEVHDDQPRVVLRTGNSDRAVFDLGSTSLLHEHLDQYAKFVFVQSI